MNYRIQNQIRSLDTLFTTVESIAEEEVQAHFAKYLCVRVSGLFENYMKSQIGDYVDASSAQPTAKFVKNKLKTFTNIDYDKLDKFLSSFDENWCHIFRSSLSDSMKSSLNSVISNRNNIAHGNPDSITFGSMKTHYSNMKLIIEILDKIIKK